MSVITDKFKKITGYDIESFLNDYIEFTATYYSRIVNYYNGRDIDRDAFNFFDKLVDKSTEINELWEIYESSFNTVDFWELMETFSEIRTKLLTINNLGKWLRSSRSDRYSTNVNVTYVQKQGESLEKIAEKSGSSDGDEGWVDIAISNDLNEEAYTGQGGTIMTVKLLNNFNFDIKNIVDSLSQQNIYGKDLQNKLELVNGDLISLSGIDSLIQTIENIFMTNKGSIPEYPEDGIDPDLIGSNVAVFNYPAQFRNIMRMMQKDDRFKVLELVSVSQEEDHVLMSLQIRTKIDDIIKQELQI